MRRAGSARSRLFPMEGSHAIDEIRPGSRAIRRRVQFAVDLHIPPEAVGNRRSAFLTGNFSGGVRHPFHIGGVLVGQPSRIDHPDLRQASETAGATDHDSHRESARRRRALVEMDGGSSAAGAGG